MVTIERISWIASLLGALFKLCCIIPLSKGGKCIVCPLSSLSLGAGEYKAKWALIPQRSQDKHIWQLSSARWGKIKQNQSIFPNQRFQFSKTKITKTQTNRGLPLFFPTPSTIFHVGSCQEKGNIRKFLMPAQHQSSAMEASPGDPEVKLVKPLSKSILWKLS